MKILSGYTCVFKKEQIGVIERNFIFISLAKFGNSFFEQKLYYTNTHAQQPQQQFRKQAYITNMCV